jgi:hypothetical protein
VLGGLAQYVDRHGGGARHEKAEQPRQRNSGKDDRRQDDREIVQRALEISQGLLCDHRTSTTSWCDVDPHIGAAHRAVSEISRRDASRDG